MKQLTFWNNPPLSAESQSNPTTTYRKAPRRILTVKELPDSEQPVNRLHFYGPAALSTSELLAILLGNSHQLHDASTLLAAFDGLTGVARAPVVELQQQPGVGATTAARIKAAFELGRRLLASHDDKVQIRSPADAANLVMGEMSLLEQEHLRTILLDTKNHVLAIPTIYVGSVNTTMIRISELFREAIRRNCPAMIIVHNHPSGAPDPSPEDVQVTSQAVEAGKLLDIECLDHIIVGSGGRFVSLKERGLGFGH
ncbi:DNA repair protein RadC [Chloroflexota bacterium]